MLPPNPSPYLSFPPKSPSHDIVLATEQDQSPHPSSHIVPLLSPSLPPSIHLHLSCILPSPQPRSQLRQSTEAQTLRHVTVRHIGVPQARDRGKHLKRTIDARARDGTRDEARGAQAGEAEVAVGGPGLVDEAGGRGARGDDAAVGSGVGERAAGGDVELLAAGDVDVWAGLAGGDGRRRRWGQRTGGRDDGGGLCGDGDGAGVGGMGLMNGEVWWVGQLLKWQNCTWSGSTLVDDEYGAGSWGTIVDGLWTV